MLSETPPAGRCAACGAANAADARFCNRCGAGLAGDAVAPPVEAERKQVTVLFSDLSGYTALSERLDPEETREVMGRVFGHAAEIVGRYDGRIEKFVGDAIMAIFGVPTAHEDDPVRAVRAALELHEAVAALGPEVERRSGAAIALHSGINTGLVVTGELRFDRGTAGPLGDTINLAARLMALAERGQIWVGPETRRLVGRAFDLEELGAREVKGKAEPVLIARVVGPSVRQEASRFRGAFVGRQEELGVLLGATEQMRDGHPGVIAICGEAGTGKTRLVEEFHARVGSDVQWLEGRAYPYAENIPYFTLIDLLNRSWGIDESDGPAAVRQKVEAGVGALVGTAGDVLPVVAPLYGMRLPDAPVIDREAYQGRLLEAVRRLLGARAGRAPTVICLQDLHWADSSSVALLRALTADLRIPALVVENHRPGYMPEPGARVLELCELSSRQTRELLHSLLDGDPPEDLVRFVEQRSGGNPFYVEEVVNSLVETHLLARNGSWHLAGSLAAAGVPTTIRGVIAARIDRLDEPRRRVLRNAAVVGREFLFSVVARLMEKADGLESSLGQLEAVDLIRAKSGAPDVEYIFKHALTQEVAYDGLLKSERQVLHARAASAMEGILKDRLPEFVETLAYHFLRGGVVDKAVPYLLESGRKCVARYAIDDAATHYRNAYQLLTGRERTPAEDRTLVELLNEWSLVYYYQGDCAPWRQLMEAHRDVAEAVGDPDLLALYLGWTGMMLWFCGEYTASLEHLDRAVRIAEEAGSRRALAYAETWRTYSLALLGRATEAITTGERAVALGRGFPEEPYLVFKPLAGVALAAEMLGDLERARLAGEELLEIAAATGNSRAAVLGHVALALRHSFALEHDRAVEAAQAAVDASRDPMYRSMSSMFSALTLGGAERWDEAARVIEEALPTADRLSLVLFATFLRFTGAVTAMARGQPARGMAALEAMRDAPTSPWAEVSTLFTLGATYARIARGAVRTAPSVLLRNPGFVLRHALPARKKARAYLDRFVDDPPEILCGYAAQAALELALLHAHRGERTMAEARAMRAIELFERQGAGEGLRRAREVIASLR